jgi:hypothetical protein
MRYPMPRPPRASLPARLALRPLTSAVRSTDVPLAVRHIDGKRRTDGSELLEQWESEGGAIAVSADIPLAHVRMARASLDFSDGRTTE